MLKLNLQYFSHLIRRTDSFEKTLMLSKIKGGRWRERQRMRCLDSITDGMDTSLSRLWKLVMDREGEGNGTPLQYSYLENPMDGGAWKAAVHGVVKSRTWLSDFTSLFTFMRWRRKWQPTPVFLPGESQGQESLVGCCLWGCTESDMTEAT